MKRALNRDGSEMAKDDFLPAIDSSAHNSSDIIGIVPSGTARYLRGRSRTDGFDSGFRLCRSEAQAIARD